MSIEDLVLDFEKKTTRKSFYYELTCSRDSISSDVIVNLKSLGHTFTQKQFDIFISEIILKKSRSWLTLNNNDFLMNNISKNYLVNRKIAMETMFESFLPNVKQLKKLTNCFPSSYTSELYFITCIINSNLNINNDYLILLLPNMSISQINLLFTKKKINFSYKTIINILKIFDNCALSKTSNNISHIIEKSKIKIDSYLLDYYFRINPNVVDIINILNKNSDIVITNEYINNILNNTIKLFETNTSIDNSDITNKLQKIIINNIDSIDIDENFLNLVLKINIESIAIINYLQKNNIVLDINKIIDTILENEHVDILKYLLCNGIISMNVRYINFFLKNNQKITFNSDNINYKVPFPITFNEPVNTYTLFSKFNIKPNNESFDIICNTKNYDLIKSFISEHDIQPSSENLEDILKESNVEIKTSRYIIESKTIKYNYDILTLNEIFRLFCEKGCKINNEILTTYYDMMDDNYNDIDFLINILSKYFIDYNLEDLYDHIFGKLVSTQIISSYSSSYNRYRYNNNNNNQIIKNKLISWNNNRCCDILKIMRKGTKSIRHVNKIYELNTIIIDVFSPKNEIDILEFIKENGIKPNFKTFSLASEKNKSGFILDLNYVPTKEDLDENINKLSLDILTRVLDYRIIPDNKTFIALVNKQSIYSNSIKNKIKLLKEYGFNISDYCIIYSLHNNYLNNDIYQDIIFSENIYYYAHIYHRTREIKNKFDIDENILTFRNMFFNSSWNSIIEFMSIHNVKIDKYCFNNSLNNQNVYEKLVELGCTPNILSLTNIRSSYNNTYLIPMDIVISIVDNIVNNHQQDYKFMKTPYDIEVNNDLDNYILYHPEVEINSSD